MEWVETTGKTIEAAREAALDRLGVAADEAEFDVVEEPRPGLFGRVRGQARVRARVKPTPVRPKQERRRKGGRDKTKPPADGPRGDASGAGAGAARPSKSATPAPPPNGSDDEPPVESPAGRGDAPRSRGRRGGPNSSEHSEEQSMSNETDRDESTATPEQVGDAAVAFMTGLTEAFGFADATTHLDIDGIELAVSVTGTELGLLVGPGGRTLSAVQDLARVAAQRRLGDHETRLRIDVAGYRQRRNEALARFALEVAESVRSTGSARSLEPMSSADRKVIHDVLNDQEGVASRSEGEDPNRRIVVVPA